MKKTKIYIATPAYDAKVCVDYCVSLIQMISVLSACNIDVELGVENGDCYIDIFSCKQFDIKTAQAVVNKYFSPSQTRVTYLTRQA